MDKKDYARQVGNIIILESSNDFKSINKSNWIFIGYFEFLKVLTRKVYDLEIIPLGIKEEFLSHFEIESFNPLLGMTTLKINRQGLEKLQLVFYHKTDNFVLFNYEADNKCIKTLLLHNENWIIIIKEFIDRIQCP